MSDDLPARCREVLDLIKELQIDGRPVPEITRRDLALYRQQYPTETIRETIGGLKNSRRIHGRTDHRVRFDPVPEWILIAEQRNIGGRSEPAIEDQREAALIELRTRGLIDRLDVDHVGFVEYLRPDGLRVEVLAVEGMPGFRVYVSDLIAELEAKERLGLDLGDELLPAVPIVWYRSFEDRRPWGYTLKPGWQAALADLCELGTGATGKARKPDRGSGEHHDRDADLRLSASQLAERYGLPLVRLSKSLERWRNKHHDGWEEIQDRRMNEPRYLYRVGSIWSLIQNLQLSDSRQTGKK